jgi:hypothetical protein
MAFHFAEYVDLLPCNTWRRVPFLEVGAGIPHCFDKNFVIAARNRV